MKQNQFKSIRSRSGQILVEYLLLMVIAVGCATLMVKALVGRDSNGSSQGMVIKQWNRILQIIGSDLPDCSKQTDFSKPNCPP